ncbi:ATP-binding protein [Gemmatimonadota bacterium]
MAGRDQGGAQAELEFDDVAPDASAMIESMRAHGYTLATAIADLIDNSIAAESQNVWLRFEWEGPDSWVSVVDDGIGMSEAELVQAMRLGSRSPLEERAATDLGRFGLGLKTASFSQARRLTVITRPTPDRTFVRRWDLDHLARPKVKGWQLLRSIHADTGDRAGLLDEMGVKRGTQVLLEVLDRVTEQGTSTNKTEDQEDHFVWETNRVQEHLAMVFHRFLAKKVGGLKIHLNGEPIEPWDPFLENHKATQLIGEYPRELTGHDTPIRVTGLVLPHRDRFKSIAQHRMAGGPEGWNAQQGFYLYRGGRLIISGSWLQLGWQKEEHFKLARLRLDIPNTMDQEWQIDVKKSTAAPPAVLREWLRGIAQQVRKQAKEVYAHRGKYRARKRTEEIQPRPWKTVTGAGGEFSYRIDRKHPVLGPLIRSLPPSGRAELEALLRLIEETVPVQRIWIDTAENQDGAALPFATEQPGELRSILLICHQAIIKHHSVDPKEAWDILSTFDGFQGSDARAIIAQIREENG